MRGSGYSFLVLMLVRTSSAFVNPHLVSKLSSECTGRVSNSRLYSDWREGDDRDSNVWISSDEESSNDWESSLEETNKGKGKGWSRFFSKDKDESVDVTISEEEEEDAWLDTLAQLTAEEVEFNMKEADRADKARQMQEWGFEASTITNTLDVATDTELEDAAQVEGMQDYREKVYEADLLDDLSEIESHTRVEKDEEGAPIRSQMVYVDEYACIGCTNCAMIAGNTFYMNDEHGRARVFSQWGDDDETIQIAIETCPVDCIHYVPFDELVKLEVERRDQNINFKARLVGASADLSHKVGGPVKFTEQQKISGNMASRCSNCPSRGCRNCPMYGIGKNPEFERKEKLRLERIAKLKLRREREKQNKSADL